MKNGRLQVGIIGCGGIAQQKHLPNLAQFPALCDVVAFCDQSVGRTALSVAKYGAPGARSFTDYRELLKDDSLDVVHVLTPNAYHAEVTVAALEAGKHVMCEKPMAETSADALRMLEASRRTGKKLTLGYQTRFRNDVLALRKAVDQGFLGDIYFAKAHAVRRRGVPNWLLHPSETHTGGPLIDIGTHALDLTLWMMGNYKPATVMGSVFWKLADRPEANTFGEWEPGAYQVEDSAFGYIKMENGATIFLESSWSLNTTTQREASTSLFGTEGGAEILGGSGAPYRLVLNTAKNGRLVDETIWGPDHVADYKEIIVDPGLREAEQWLRAILDDTQPSVLPEQGYIVTRILEAVYESQRTNQIIRF